MNLQKDIRFSKDFRARIITGVLLVLIVVGSVIYSSYNFIFLVLLINYLALNEFYTLMHAHIPKKLIGEVFSLFLFTTASLTISGLMDARILVFNIPFAFSVFMLALYDRSPRPFVELAGIFLGLVYITIPCILLLLIGFSFPNVVPFHGTYNSHLILGLFLIVWALDSGAYLVGTTFGSHALFKSVSPAKTWEGWIGGVICALLTAFVVSRYFEEIATIHWIMVASIVVTVGTYGDLIKSRLKRSLGVKDSGKILPGHGGILDRFDSLLSSTPLIYFYLMVYSIFN